ncbi:MAG: hypothetical protein K9K62_09945 [Desulfobacteraceae bacterium]|nr:hypothetical protein [Desulfobacteraceae bacterium]
MDDTESNFKYAEKTKEKQPAIVNMRLWTAAKGLDLHLVVSLGDRGGGYWRHMPGG